MVSRDLICDEAMPPLDDGDNMLDIHRMRTTPAAFVRQQQQQPNIQQNAYLNNINISSTEIGSSRTPSSMIPNGEGFTHQPNVLDHNTTVREVITRQIKNNRLKVNSRQGFSNFDVMASTIPQYDGRNNILSQQNHHLISSNSSHSALSNQNTLLTNGNNARLLVGNYNNSTIYISSSSESAKQHLLNQPSNIEPVQSVFVVNATAQNPRMPTNTSNKQQQYKSNTIINYQHDQPQQQQQQISTIQWAEYPLVDQQHTSNLQQQQKSPKKLLVTQLCPSSYPVVMPPLIENETTANDVTGVASPSTSNSGQQNQISTCAHSSPRPSILRGHNTLRRVADRERPASTSEIYDGYGNGTTRLANCSSHGDKEDFNTFDETPKKRARKQHFENIALQQDKLMMEISANDIRLQQHASADLPLNTRTSSHEEQITTAVNPLPLAHGIAESAAQRVSPKKRGRPKIKNQAQIPMSFQIVQDDGNTTQIIQGNNHNNLGNLTSNISNKTNTAASITDQQPIQAQRMMVEVDSILQTNKLDDKRRKYTKRAPKIDSSTGEIKKVRKKGSGRKSKRETELAAQQQRESAILAGMGMSFSSDLHLQQQFNTSLHNKHETELQQHQIYASKMPYITNSSSIEAKEHDVIHALCRFRRDSEQQQQKQLKRKSAANNGNYATDTATRKLSTIYQKNTTTFSSISSISNEGGKQRSHTMEKQQHNSASIISSKHLRCTLPLLELNRTLLQSLFQKCGTKLRKQFEKDNLIELYEQLNNLCHPTATFDQTKPSTSDATAIFCTEFMSDKRTLPASSDQNLLDNIVERICCPIFDSYEQFKLAVKSLRMLPSACSYLTASKRLLHLIQTHLIAHFVCDVLDDKNNPKSQTVNTKLDDLEARDLIPLSMLRLPITHENVCSSEHTDQIQNLAHKLESQFFDHQSNHDDANLCSLFTHFDVAQTLDSVLNRVERNSLQNTEQEPSKMNFNKTDKQRSHCSTTFDDCSNRCSIFKTDIVNCVPKAFFQVLNSNNKKPKKRRRAHMKEWSTDEDDTVDSNLQLKVGDCCSAFDCIEENCPENDNTNKNRKFIHPVSLDQISSLYRRADNDLTQLNELGTKLNSMENEYLSEQTTKPNMKTPPQLLELFKQDGQKKKAIHKSNQFLFRPSMRLLETIFEDVVSFERQPVNCMEGLEQVETNVVEDEAIITHHDDNPKQQQQPKLIMNEIEQLLIDSEHSSARAATQLRYICDSLRSNADDNKRITEKLAISNRNCPSKINVDEIDVIDHCEQFKQSLRYVIPVADTLESQNQYIESRLRELREIYEVTMGLVQHRAIIAGECKSCLQEYESSTEQPQENEKRTLTTSIERLCLHSNRPINRNGTTATATTVLRKFSSLSTEMEET